MADPKKENRIISEVFRFASVRGPQTMSTRDAEIRTIPFLNTKGAFFIKLLNTRNSGVTHAKTMANLKTECATMKDGVNYFKSMDDLYGVTDMEALREFAETLIRNRRSNELSTVLAPAIVGLKTLPTNLKNILWNNLFVHMISGGNVYIRQEIINILVANNFLENYSGLRDDEQKILANANLVLPATLFPLTTEEKVSDNEEAGTDDNTIEIDKDAAVIRIANRERIINEINRLIYLRGEMVRPVDTVVKDDRGAVNLYLVFSEDFHSSMDQDIVNLLSTEMRNIGFSYGIGIYSVINLLESANSHEYNQLFRNAKLGKEVAVIGSGVYKRGGPGDGRPNLSNPPKGNSLENDPYAGIYPYGSYGKIKPLGVMDLRIVEQELCCYIPGEVAHIENIMQGEYKERATRRLRRTEETFSSTVETETLDEADTESTDRYEMQKEASKELAKDKSFELGVNVSTKIPYVNIDASTSYSNSTSSQESYSSAVNYAKEVTHRALKRVQEKIIEEQSLKIINEFEENNRHGLDNRFGEGHSVGIYRWIDKIYKATVKNYGKRLMFEFMIPDPASYYIWSKTRAGEADSPQLVEPIAPWSNAVSEFGTPLTSHTQITRSNYDNWAAAYGAEVSAPKREEVIVSKAFAGNHDAQQIVAGVHDIEIPEGYETKWANIKVDIIPASGVEIGNFKVSIGDSQTFVFGPTSGQVNYQNWGIPVHNISGSVPVRYTAYHQESNHNTLGVYIVCRFKSEAEEEWKMKTYRSIIDAYERRKAEYQSKLAEAKSVELYSIEGKNPGFNRKIEQRELKKGCMKWLFEQFSDQYNPQSNGFGHFGMSGYNSTDPSQPPMTAMNEHVLHEGQKAKYANNSFDWSLMSYSFLPYYWSGDKSRWVQTTALEDNDHIFQEFLQAGFAKVMVPVKPGREKSIMHFLSNGSMLEGDNLPNLPGIFTDIIVDLSKEDDFSDIPDDERTWELRVPSSLTALQASNIGIEGKGLPCECEPEGEGWGLGAPFTMVGLDNNDNTGGEV